MRSLKDRPRGKITISEEILSKPGTLTDEEYLKIKKHSEAGYKIVKNIVDSDRIAFGYDVKSLKMIAKRMVQKFKEYNPNDPMPEDIPEPVEEEKQPVNMEIPQGDTSE